MGAVAKYELATSKSTGTHSGLMASFTAKVAELLSSAGNFVYHFTHDQVKQVRDYWQRKLLSHKSQPGLTAGSTTCLNSLLWAKKPYTWQELTDPMLDAWYDFSTAYANSMSWGGLASAANYQKSGRSRNQPYGGSGQTKQQ